MRFISELCKEVFRGAELFLDAEPEFAIAKGLALAGRLDIKTKEFTDEVNKLINSNEIKKIVDKNIPILLSSIAEVISQRIPDQFILPAFDDWTRGKIVNLAAMERVVVKNLKDWLESAGGRKAIAPYIMEWFKEITPEIDNLTNPICDKYHIQRSVLALPSLDTPRGKLPPGIFDPIDATGIDDFGAIIAFISGIIVATIASGAGTSLNHPRL